MSVRTRVAPSPTGDPHLGTAYIALFNYVFAKKNGGQFILRIEDTDRIRSSSAAEHKIYEALRWLGMDWSEGPDKGGDYGPYRQSERLDIYNQYVNQLIDQGDAFHCFCTQERLDLLRQTQREAQQTTRYDGLCSELDKDEVRRRIDAGDTYVVRLRVPNEGESVFSDGIRGEIRIPWSQVDMQVLLKSDGFPTYHLAVVVDDHLMQISHVLRGEEWINSLPKHQLLYRYFGWEMPIHYHLPLLRNPDQSKMSKRKNPTSINYYRDSGYLPEALTNYLSLMGWSMPDEREIFKFSEFVDSFDTKRFSVRGPIFDPEKLNWMNGQYIRDLDENAFIERVRNWIFNEEKLRLLVPLVIDRTERLADLIPQVDYLLGERQPIDETSFAHKSLSLEESKRILSHIIRRLEFQSDWSKDELYTALKALSDTMHLKFRDFLFPLFVSISGKNVSLPLFDSMSFLGAELTRSRVRSGIEALGGNSKKETRRLDKEFAKLQHSI